MRARYRLTTDEPPKMHRGVLLVELLGGSAIPKAGIGPQPTGAKPDSFCELWLRKWIDPMCSRRKKRKGRGGGGRSLRWAA